MTRCWFHSGQWMPCAVCAGANAIQRAEDLLLVTQRRVSRASVAACRANGSKYGKRVPTRLASIRKPGTCLRGHDKQGRRSCRECERKRHGQIPLASPVRCSECGVIFVRQYGAQRRCPAHIQRQRRRAA